MTRPIFTTIRMRVIAAAEPWPAPALERRYPGRPNRRPATAKRIKKVEAYIRYWESSSDHPLNLEQVARTKGVSIEEVKRVRAAMLEGE